MEENIEIPEEVVSEEAYRKLLKLMAHPIITKPILKTSDGLEVDIRIMVHQLRKRIEHLPLPEQEKFERLKALYYRVNNNLTAQKRKAFGKTSTRLPGNFKEGTILEMRKTELLEYFGKMFDINDILRMINVEWGCPVTYNTLVKFRATNNVEIAKLVEIHKTSYHNVRLGVKKSRLEELSSIYKKAKITWEDADRREDLKVLLTILEQIRKEAEGDRLTVEGKVDITYEHNINDHLMKEVFSTTNLKEIILGRVAAKMNINPIKLIYSLQNSYYKKFSNVLGDIEENEPDQIIYPSQLSYDFERIGKKFSLRDKEIEDAVIVEETANTNDSERAKGIAEALKVKLKNKNNLLKAFRNKMDIESQDREIKNQPIRKTKKKK